MSKSGENIPSTTQYSRDHYACPQIRRES